MNKIFSESKILDQLIKYEAKGACCQSNIIQESASGYQVRDGKGKSYIDFSLGVMITNAGYGHEQIKQVIIDQLNTEVFTSYSFPMEERKWQDW